MATLESLIMAELMSSAITALAACLRVEQMSRNITTAAAWEICIPLGNGISSATGAHLLDWG